MTWTDTTLCENVFMVLVNTQQIDPNYPFLQAGALPMSGLPFFVNGATPAIIQANAGMLATTMDGQFISDYGAQYVGNTTKSSALTAMQAILVIGDNTIEDLANAISQVYVFTE